LEEVTEDKTRNNDERGELKNAKASLGVYNQGNELDGSWYDLFHSLI
jgi:hypothetical protein